MSSRAATRLAWTLWGLSILAVVLSVPLVVLNDLGLGDWVFGLATVPVFATVGAVVASRRPENAIGWIFCVIGLSNGVLTFSQEYALYGLFTEPGALPAAAGVIESTYFLAGLQFGLLITFALLLFPDGRLPSRRWLPVAWMCALGVALMTAGLGLGAVRIGGRELMDRLMEGAETVPVQGTGIAGLLNGVGHLMVFAGLAAAVVSLFVRRWYADRMERQQIKWFAYAAAMFALAILSFALPWPEIISEVLEVAAAVFLPIAIGIAVLRYRLYDIDRLVNRTLVYGALTVMLVAVYAGGVAGFQYLFRAVTGQESQLAVVASTLAIAALFGPLRRRVQAFIDRRFYRKKYDAAKTLEAFGARLRDETDLERLGGDLVAVVRETTQPEHVSLWLRPADQSGGERVAEERER
ncbi:MAG: hypothetical protein ACFB50_15335 [Rubrobacteraceae bacterium]